MAPPVGMTSATARPAAPPAAPAATRARVAWPSPATAADPRSRLVAATIGKAVASCPMLLASARAPTVSRGGARRTRGEARGRSLLLLGAGAVGGEPELAEAERPPRQVGDDGEARHTWREQQERG